MYVCTYVCVHICTYVRTYVRMCCIRAVRTVYVYCDINGVASQNRLLSHNLVLLVCIRTYIWAYSKHAFSAEAVYVHYLCIRKGCSCALTIL